MATGVKSYIDMTGTNGISIRVGYQETYDIATNASSLGISYIYVKSSSYYGVTYYLNGSISNSATGATAVSMDSSSGTHSVTISELNTWYEVSGSLGSINGIAHNNDGSGTVSISVNIKGYTVSGNAGSGWTVSGTRSIKLTTIARKSTLTASNGTLGTEQTLTINRYSNNFYHSIRYDCGSASVAVCTKVSDTEISFTPPLTLAKQNKTGTSVSITFTLYTFDSDASDATEIGRSTKTITCAIPASVKPSCEIAVTDVLNHVATYGGYVQGQSKLEVIVTPTLAYESPIATYTVTADGKTYNYSDVEISSINSSGDVTISATVKDKRSRVGTDSETITVLPYSVPSISLLTVYRCDEDGTENPSGAYALITYSLNITSLSSKNTKEIKLKYKKTTSTSYTSVTLDSVYSASSATYILAVDTTSSYDIVLTVQDSFASSSRSLVVSSGYAYMDWYYDNNSLGLGKVAEVANALDMGWDIEMNGHRINGFIDIGAFTGDINSLTELPINTVAWVTPDTINTPNGNYGFLETWGSSNGIRIQRFNSFGGVPYLRQYCNSKWYDWYKTVTTQNLLDLVYPVNSIYISYSHTSPAELFGGTWYRIQSRFLWGTTTEGTIGATAGEQTHTLTEAEMPKHRHTTNTNIVNAAGSGSAAGAAGGTDRGFAYGTAYNTSYTGSGSAHNNMPPYVNVAIWRRTA